MKRRLTVGAGVLAAGLVLSGCSAGEGVAIEDPGSVIQAAIAGEPDQLDPQKTSSYFSFQVLENVYDTLVEPDENLEMQPALAEDWELSDDQLTWTFELREGVTFHDGSEFTADDVVYSYNRFIHEEPSNAWRLSAITDITATHDTTVEITVAQPTPNLLSSPGGFEGLAIVNEDNATCGDISTAPVGTVPFALENYTSGDSIALVANDDYWGAAREIAGVTCRFISEASTALAALKSGDVGWTDSIPA